MKQTSRRPLPVPLRPKRPLKESVRFDMKTLVGVAFSFLGLLGTAIPASAQKTASLVRSADNHARLELVASGEVAGRGYLVDALAVRGAMVVAGSSGTPLLGRSVFQAGEVRVLHVEGGRLAEQARLAEGFRYSFFGEAVAFGGDALVVGAPNYGGGGTANGRMAKLDGEGQLYVFRRSGQDQTWVEADRIEPPARHSPGQFGNAIEISGQRAIVGARRTHDGDLPWRPGSRPGFGAGAAFIFRLDDQVWRLDANLKNPAPTTIGEFGCSVDIAEDTAVVSSARNNTLGRVFTYHRVQDRWRRTASIWPPGSTNNSDYYCPPVALRGNQMLVGGYGESHLLEWNGSSWRTREALMHPDSGGAARVHLGNDMAVIAAGETVYLYGRGKRGWRLLSEAALDGPVIQLDVDGDIVAVGYLRYVSLFRVVE